MAFAYYFKISFRDGSWIDAHADSERGAIAYALERGFDTTSITRIEAKESGKASGWRVVWPKVGAI